MKAGASLEAANNDGRGSLRGSAVRRAPQLRSEAIFCDRAPSLAQAFCVSHCLFQDVACKAHRRTGSDVDNQDRT